MGTRQSFAQQYAKATAAMGIKPQAYDVSTRRLMPPTTGGYSLVLICNVNKENRPRNPPATGQGQKPSCGLCKDIERAKTTGDNMMFKDEYEPFKILPNPFPFDMGHVMMIDDAHSDSNYCVPTIEKLETIVRFADATGVRGWRNVLGTNSSVPKHEHTHMMPVQYAVEYAQTRELADGIEEIISFPGQNLVFSGKDRVRLAHEIMTDIQKEKHPSEDMQKLCMFPFVTLFADGKIYIAPVKVPQYSKPGNVGAGEIFGLYATPIKQKLLKSQITDEKWNSMNEKERATMIQQIQADITHEEILGSLRNVLFQQDDMPNLKKLAKV